MTRRSHLRVIDDMGAGLWDLARDLKPRLRPGDQVVLVETRSSHGTLDHLGMSLALAAWGPDVTVTRVATGQPMQPVRPVTRAEALALGRAAATGAVLSEGVAPPPAPRAARRRASASGKAPIGVFRAGRHMHRSPLAYAALAPLWEGRIRFCDMPEGADLIVFSHPADLAMAEPRVIDALIGFDPPTPVLLSEEPFWDSLFSPDPTAACITATLPDLGAVRVAQISHASSPVFAGGPLPYYLLTHHRFANAYGARFARNAGRTPADWRARMAAAPVDAVFMAERRPERVHDVAFTEGELLGLCRWRTRLAETCGLPWVERLGASWTGGPRRQAIGPWHLDKIVRLDGRARWISAIENTHHPDYLSEKFFDAFACGARPIYMAGPRHRVHDLGLPPGAWLNLHGQTPESADRAMKEAPWDDAFFRDYAAAQAGLAALFCDPGLWVRARARLRTAVLAALEGALA